MTIETNYNIGDIVWIKVNGKYYTGKIDNVYSWDTSDGFFFTICYVDDICTTHYCKSCEDEICPYDEKDYLIKKMFVNNINETNVIKE